VKYLEIIQQQETMINELSKSNTKLVQRNKELKQHKMMYKENAQHWKTQHDILKSCVDDITQKCVNVYEANAIKIYKENERF
jgi:hypothetical protein